jgi:hypothetical protein
MDGLGRGIPRTVTAGDGYDEARRPSTGAVLWVAATCEPDPLTRQLGRHAAVSLLSARVTAAVGLVVALGALHQVAPALVTPAVLWLALLVALRFAGETVSASWQPLAVVLARSLLVAAAAALALASWDMTTAPAAALAGALVLEGHGRVALWQLRQRLVTRSSGGAGGSPPLQRFRDRAR